MAGRLRGWLKLSPRERVQFIALVPALAGVHAALAMFGYVRTRRWLERCSRHANPHSASKSDLAAATRLAELATIAGRHGLVTASCLRQSLLVYAWLRRCGLDPQLQIGVRKDGGGLEAHAWVALSGAPLSDVSPSDWSPLQHVPTPG
ncbi:MAG: lasso peptide biosynthesis B2 protein [Xanthomonadales bacterium]|nr:lasso peptide biosynthesis B2 protein [Xanthomonadales bacterium]MBK7143951.1 lasso peptide biosynthesis B2 protein [Xanthomonadales bacterium]MCC6560328.1 lasso peptide biosynthesis B2 protein [Xanthomonadales bacterium]